MSLERLKRVLWRIQEWKKQDNFTKKHLRRAIMLECGTCERAILDNTKKLKELGMIKATSTHTYKIINDSPA